MARSLRNHMAAHILKYRDEGTGPVLPSEPCAYCCGSTCSIIASGGTKNQLPSQMIHIVCNTFTDNIPDLKRMFYKPIFGYPSTQSPYQCPLCSLNIWSMNIVQHFDDHHPGEKSTNEINYKGYLPSESEKQKVLRQNPIIHINNSTS